MGYIVTSSANYHWVKKITAETNGDGVLKLTFIGDPDVVDHQFNKAEVNIFTDNVDMVDRLIDAINGVNESIDWSQDSKPQGTNPVPPDDEIEF